MKMSEAKEIITSIVTYNLEEAKRGKVRSMMTPVLVGDPGLGKTAICRQSANELQIFHDTVIIAQWDPAELGGFPKIVGDEAIRTRASWMPKQGEGILLLDELAQAPLANLNIVAQIVEERCIGEHRIAPGWSVVAATNKLSNRAGVNPMPTHLKDRLMFLPVEADLGEFIEHAQHAGFHPFVTAYHRFRGGEWLHKFDPAQDSCPSPRSWEKVSEILYMAEKTGLSETGMWLAIEGTVGKAARVDMEGFVRFFSKIPDLEQIWSDPKNAELPANSDPGLQWATVSALAARATTKNLSAAIDYMLRFPRQELVSFAVSEIMARHDWSKTHAGLTKWVIRSGADLHSA